jgi:hypothetical protein
MATQRKANDRSQRGLPRRGTQANVGGGEEGAASVRAEMSVFDNPTKRFNVLAGDTGILFICCKACSGMLSRPVWQKNRKRDGGWLRYAEEAEGGWRYCSKKGVHWWSLVRSKVRSACLWDVPWTVVWTGVAWHGVA